MSEPAILDTLRGVEFFQEIADEHLHRVAEIARPVEFPANSEMFHEHDIAKDVYVIVSGQVSLVICQPKVGCRQLMQVGDGEFVGWSPLVGRAHLTDTAHTLTAVKALAFDAEALLAQCSADPKFGLEFMQRVAVALAQRLSATRLQLLKLSGMALPAIQIESD